MREVVTRSPYREVGVVNAPYLLNHEVHHESHLERRFIHCALSCPVVLDIRHQIEIELSSGKRYTADFGLTLLDGLTVMVEVKPEIFVGKHLEKLTDAKRVSESLGQRFVLVTDEHIDKSGLWREIKDIKGYAKHAVDPIILSKCKKTLIEDFKGQGSVAELMAAAGVGEYVIWNLVSHRKLFVIPPFRMNKTSFVLANHPVEDCYVFFCSWFGIEAGKCSY